MKKTLQLLTFSLSIIFGFSANAQEYNLNMFDQAIYYGMYEGTVSEPIPDGAIRNSNSSYGKKFTEEQLASFGNTLTMTVTLHPLCDNYDRIGNVNLVFTEKGATTYDYNEVTRIEIGRFITPFMDLRVTDPDHVPYVFELDNVTGIFHDEEITSNYDIWIELEVYGYQGGPGQGGAAAEIPICEGRNDVYMGSLDFTSTTDESIEEPNLLIPLEHKYELKNYTLDGTDVLGETVRTLYFTLEEPVTDATIHLITSNHGANSGGEEYIRRWHYVYFDNDLVANYKPGGVSCVPFFEYNTQPSCIYYDCSTNPAYPRPDNDAAWSWNNWCPGDKIPNRVIELGDLDAGEHSFKIDVPDAQFADNQGYFPMSVYIQGHSATGGLALDTPIFEKNSFSIYPNPVEDVVTISTEGKEIALINVVNTLGQTVFTGKSEKIDLSEVQQGMYVVEVKFADGTDAVKKIVKK